MSPVQVVDEAKITKPCDFNFEEHAISQAGFPEEPQVDALALTGACDFRLLSRPALLSLGKHIFLPP